MRSSGAGGAHVLAVLERRMPPLSTPTRGTGAVTSHIAWMRTRGGATATAALCIVLLLAIFNVYMWSTHSLSMHAGELKTMQRHGSMQHGPAHILERPLTNFRTRKARPAQSVAAVPAPESTPVELQSSSLTRIPGPTPTDCRPGTQRCIAWSTSTSVSRFPFVVPPRPAGAAGSTRDVPGVPFEPFDLTYSLLSTAHLQPHARSRSPYDIDGTPLLRAELQEYIVRHLEATDLKGVEQRIHAEVDAAVAAGGGTTLDGVSLPSDGAARSGSLFLARYRRWRTWLDSQRYLLYVDGEEGMGNKFQPLISSFALALLQKRVFLIYFSMDGFEDMFNMGPRKPPEQLSDDPEIAAWEARLPLLTSWHRFVHELVEVHRRFDPSWTGEVVGDASAAAKDGRASAAKLLGLSNNAESKHWSTAVLAQLAPNLPQEQRLIEKHFMRDHLSLFPQGGPLQNPTAPTAPSPSVELAPTLTALDIYMAAADSTQQEADLMCNDLLAENDRYTRPWLVSSHGYQYWGSVLAANPSTRKRMLSLLNEGTIYGPLARFVFNWSPERVRAPANQFTRAHFSQYNIGVQLRLKERLALQWPEVKAAVEAARALAVLHQPPDSELEVMPASERAAQLKGRPENTAPPNTFGMFLRQRDSTSPSETDAAAADAMARRNKPFVTFFLATDDFSIRPSIVAQLSPYGHVAHSPSQAYPRNEAHGAYYAGKGEQFEEGLKWSILDHLLLAACDDIITSPSSTFGYISHGYSGLIPHRIKSSQSSDDANRPHALRALSAEPNSHWWKPVFREVSRWGLCRIEADLPAQAQTEECCPRWSNEGPNTVNHILREWPRAT